MDQCRQATTQLADCVGSKLTRSRTGYHARRRIGGRLQRRKHRSGGRYLHLQDLNSCSGRPARTCLSSPVSNIRSPTDPRPGCVPTRYVFAASRGCSATPSTLLHIWPRACRTRSFRWPIRQTPLPCRPTRSTCWFCPRVRVLETDFSSDVEIYTDTAKAIAGVAPTVTSFPTTVNRGINYTVKGKQLNGADRRRWLRRRRAVVDQFPAGAESRTPPPDIYSTRRPLPSPQDQ